MGHPTMTAYGFFQLNNLAGELDIPDTVFANRDLSPTDFFRTQTASFLIRERNVNPVSEPPILMLFGVAGLAMFVRRFARADDRPNIAASAVASLPDPKHEPFDLNS